jgi:hypothetical protein
MVNRKSNQLPRIGLTIYILVCLIGLGVLSSPLFMAKASVSSTLPVLNTTAISKVDGLLGQRTAYEPFTPLDLTSFTFGNPEPFR